MKDIMLISLVKLAMAETPSEQDVTLVVGGFLVSGYVISYEKYVQHHQLTNTIDEALKQL